MPSLMICAPVSLLSWPFIIAHSSCPLLSWQALFFCPQLMSVAVLAGTLFLPTAQLMSVAVLAGTLFLPTAHVRCCLGRHSFFAHSSCPLLSWQALFFCPQLMSVAVLALHYCPQLMPSAWAVETGESGPVTAAEAEHTTMQCFIQHGHGE